MTAASHERTLQQLHQHRSITTSLHRLSLFQESSTDLESIHWVAQSGDHLDCSIFACIINITKAASLVSFEYRSFQARTILPTDSLPHLRVPLGAFHQPQASLVRVQYLEVNWFSCLFLGHTGELEFVPLLLHRLPFVDRSADPADDQSTEQVPPSYNSDAAAPEYQEAPWSVTQRSAPLPCADV